MPTANTSKRFIVPFNSQYPAGSQVACTGDGGYQARYKYERFAGTRGALKVPDDIEKKHEAEGKADGNVTEQINLAAGKVLSENRIKSGNEANCCQPGERCKMPLFLG